MNLSKLLFALPICAALLGSCAPPQARVASTPKPAPTWAFEASDVPVEAGWKFGQLPNGMRYVIRANATPKGTALVRMQIAAGSIDEAETERGYAHFVEHMAFNGSTNVPEGEMVKLLEREGLAFGADTNASTGFEATTYKLDLPRNDPKLIDTALMLMRETASELTISEAAVGRERGVVLSEMRDRNTYALRNFVDQLEFLLPGALVSKRLPIGTKEALEGANAAGIKAFWAREYVPGHTTLVVIGDLDPVAIEAQIKARFGDWPTAKTDPQPKFGPMSPDDQGKADLFIDPALSERVVVARKGTWLDEPDSIAQRNEDLLRQIAYGIINRRLQRLTVQANPPFRAAGFGSSGLFREARETELVVDTVDGQWRGGLLAAGAEYHRAIVYGFTAEEVAEQVANFRTAFDNAAKSEATRSNAALVGTAIALIDDEIVPASPIAAAQWFEQLVPQITPAAVLTAMQREALPLDRPLIRFQGRTAPAGDEAGLIAAWSQAMQAPISPPQSKGVAVFGYTDFGLATAIVSDTRDAALGIRQVRFGNGVRLNIKRTDLEKDRVLVRASVDGGNMLNTRSNPLATRMAGVLSLGGLGKHSKDELDTILAGRNVSAGYQPSDEAFVATAGTTPRDLELEFQYLAAQIVDPGWRSEGEVLFQQSINNYFASLRATPGGALGADLGGIVSNDDPRYSLGAVDDWRKLTFPKLKSDIGDRLSKGAIEIGVVGDVDEAQVIALVGKTFGALPVRESEFRSYDENRDRAFTANRKPRVLRHTGAKDQALLTLIWPTRDGEDPAAEAELMLLGRVAQLALTDTLREKLGKAYSPGASSSTSRVWKGYGTFLITASVDVKEVGPTRAAMLETIAGLRDTPLSADIVQRAKAPVLEAYDNLLKSNGGWLGLVSSAQSRPDRIERYLRGRNRIAAITGAQLQALARLYLIPFAGLEVLVLPEGIDPPLL
ncbi:MAG: insulinase family protein [Novosphingobium sp.]|uniref:M16 family metallopeptidase n=1 Tax=Novosphingobium sp. TaxID=1874826 RepID=UPI0032BB0258